MSLGPLLPDSLRPALIGWGWETCVLVLPENWLFFFFKDIVEAQCYKVSGVQLSDLQFFKVILRL